MAMAFCPNSQDHKSTKIDLSQHSGTTFMFSRNQYSLLIACAVAIYAINVKADTYKVYFPSTMPGMIMDGQGVYYTDKEILIVNNDTRVVKRVDADAYLLKFDPDNAYDFGETGVVEVNGTSPSRSIVDLKSNIITFKEAQMVIVQDNNGTPQDTTDDGDQLYFDRVLSINVDTGEIVSDTLIANSEEAATYAANNGMSLDTVNLGDVQNTTQMTFTSYAENVTNDADSGALVDTNGNFSTAQISDSEGNSLFRQEADGTVHIGENSIVLSDESVSSSGFDEVYSSSSVLQLGNNSSHRTVVKGALEIEEPTAPQHATTKNYVDVLNASARRYSDSLAAMSTAIASMPQAQHGQRMLTFGTGFRNGEHAIALGISVKPITSAFSLNINAAYSDYASKPTVGAGVGLKF